MGQVRGEAGFLQKLRNGVTPTVRDGQGPPEIPTSLVALRKTYEEQAKQVIYDLWSSRTAKPMIVRRGRRYPQLRAGLLRHGAALPCLARHDDRRRSLPRRPLSQQVRRTGGEPHGNPCRRAARGFPRMSRPRPEMVDRVNKRWDRFTRSRAQHLRTGTG